MSNVISNMRKRARGARPDVTSRLSRFAYVIGAVIGLLGALVFTLSRAAALSSVGKVTTPRHVYFSLFIGYLMTIVPIAIASIKIALLSDGMTVRERLNEALIRFKKRGDWLVEKAIINIQLRILGVLIAVLTTIITVFSAYIAEEMNQFVTRAGYVLVPGKLDGMAFWVAVALAYLYLPLEGFVVLPLLDKYVDLKAIELLLEQKASFATKYQSAEGQRGDVDAEGIAKDAKELQVEAYGSMMGESRPSPSMPTEVIVRKQSEEAHGAADDSLHEQVLTETVRARNRTSTSLEEGHATVASRLPGQGG